MGEHSLPGYGSVGSLNRLVRTRMLGGVGRAGEKPALTRFAFFFFQVSRSTLMLRILAIRLAIDKESLRLPLS